MVMKTSQCLFILAFLLSSCASITRLSNNAIYHTIVGQTEFTVYERLGPPARTLQTKDGEKKLVYEYHSKGMFTHPNKSKLTFSQSGDMSNQEPRLNWKFSSVDTKTNSPEYTVYQDNTSVLEVYINAEGECVSFQQNLNKQELEQLYQTFSKYVPGKGSKPAL